MHARVFLLVIFTVETLARSRYERNIGNISFSDRIGVSANPNGFEGGFKKTVDLQTPTSTGLLNIFGLADKLNKKLDINGGIDFKPKLSYDDDKKDLGISFGGSADAGFRILDLDSKKHSAKVPSKKHDKSKERKSKQFSDESFHTRKFALNGGISDVGRRKRNQIRGINDVGAPADFSYGSGRISGGLRQNGEHHMRDSSVKRFHNDYKSNRADGKYTRRNKDVWEDGEIIIVPIAGEKKSGIVGGTSQGSDSKSQSIGGHGTNGKSAHDEYQRILKEDNTKSGWKIVSEKGGSTVTTLHDGILTNKKKSGWIDKTSHDNKIEKSKSDESRSMHHDDDRVADKTMLNDNDILDNGKCGSNIKRTLQFVQAFIHNCDNIIHRLLKLNEDDLRDTLCHILPRDNNLSCQLGCNVPYIID